MVLALALSAGEFYLTVLIEFERKNRSKTLKNHSKTFHPSRGGGKWFLAPETLFPPPLIDRYRVRGMFDAIEPPCIWRSTNYTGWYHCNGEKLIILQVIKVWFM